MLLPSRLGCLLSLKTPNMGNPGLRRCCDLWFKMIRLKFEEAIQGMSNDN